MSPPRCLLSLWNGPTMVGGFYLRALQKIGKVWSVGPEMGQKSDFPCRVGDPILPVLQKLEGQVDVLIQFYSKPDYFPPDLYLVNLPKVWVLYDLHLHAEELSRSCYLFDLILVTDNSSRERLNQLGVHHVEILPFAVDDNLFYRPWQERPRQFEVGFSGSVTNHPQLRERAKLLKKVGESFQLKLENRSLTGAQVADFYQDCRVVLNQAVHNDVNMRIMEVLMAGRPLVTPWVPSLEEVIQDGEHALVYKSEEECFRKIAQLLENPQEAEAMARRGQAHALAHFRYEVTAQKMLNILEGQLEKWRVQAPRSKNLGQLQAAQWRYHWFRFPGDALNWLLAHGYFQGFPGRISKVALKLSIHGLHLGERWRKVRYFQRME
jgi:hypothetical protein